MKKRHRIDQQLQPGLQLHFAQLQELPHVQVSHVQTSHVHFGFLLSVEPALTSVVFIIYGFNYMTKVAHRHCRGLTQLWERFTEFWESDFIQRSPLNCANFLEMRWR